VRQAKKLLDYLIPLPLFAVLRGIKLAEIPAIGESLTAEGFRILEVPLNSPQPYGSIARLAQDFGEHCLIGAGTVIDPTQVAEVKAAGGRLIVMPHADLAVVRAAKAAGMVCVPGVATPTEAFAALDAGSDALKMFPAESMPPPVLRAWRAVLPQGTLIFPVGGIKPESMAAYWAAGATGFGTGTNLYAPDADPLAVRRVAAAYATTFRSLPPR
jgi:2-dehydro-3-deoxyphosphogalactonate aldolase